jgi:mRNA capping enzyme, catalytic domain/mRNA capping enzyme, C-terminal domain
MIFETRPYPCLELDVDLHRVLFEDARILLSVLVHLTAPPKLKPKRGETCAKYQFPAPNPVSIDSTMIHVLRRQPYFITEKTDGIRFILLFSDAKERHVGALFDRTLSPFIFKCETLPKVMYQGSVLDGELTRDATGKLVFLIFDCMVAAGVPLFHLPFQERLLLLERALKHYSPSLDDTAEIRLKSFVQFSPDTDAWKRHYEAARKLYKTDGIIFQPALENIFYGRQDSLFKLKTQHTVDFLLKGGKLYVYDETTKRNKAIAKANASLPHTVPDGSIVECQFNGIDWDVLCVRKDKDMQNTKYVYEKTLLNIRERLTYDHIVRAVF